MDLREKTLEFVRDYAPKADRIGRYVFLHRLHELMFESVPGVELPDTDHTGRSTAISGQSPAAAGRAAKERKSQ